MMPGLQQLPAEILEAVFFHLPSIDDVHSLGRSCKAAFHIISKKPVYMDIMRHIIGTSYQHRFDVSLCRLLDLHESIARGISNTGRPIRPAHPHPPIGTSMHPFADLLTIAVTGECLHGPSNSQVNDILARYQGLRILEDMWLSQQLSSSDLFPLDSTEDPIEFINLYRYFIERQETTRRYPKSEEAATYVKFDVDQRNRFYAAIIVVWIMNEIRWIIMQFDWRVRDSIMQNGSIERYKRWIDDHTHEPVLEYMDRYTMYHFIYHHLLPQHCTFLSDGCSSQLPLTYPSNLDRDPQHCANLLKICLSAGQAYLQPPDIIDLAVRHRSSRRRRLWPLGAFPQSTERYQIPCTSMLSAPNLDYSTRIPATLQNPRPFRPVSEGMRHINLMQQTNLGHIPNTLLRLTPHAHTDQGMIRFPDDMSAYLERQLLTKFDLYAKPNGRDGIAHVVVDIGAVFGFRWRHMWWTCWWWANSDDKARAKMERWRKRIVHA